MKNMKHNLLFLLLIIFSSSYGETQKVDYILNSKVLLIDKIDQKETEGRIFLKTGFAFASIINTSEFEKVQNNVILKIELVFTTFKLTPHFDQKSLNAKRLYSLKQLDPELIMNDLIEWSLIAQTSCNSPLQGDEFFHGFIITYRPTSTIETIGKEIEYIKNVLLDKRELKSIDEFVVDKNGVKYITCKLIPLTDSFYHANFSLDSTVLKILNRNTDWNKMLVVCDFTGSMSPYTSQLLIWHKLNIGSNKQRIKFFTFFNDGDQKSDKQKLIGQTGGIYHAQAQNFDDIKDLALKTMGAGCGGDRPENNIEALLEAIAKCEDCEDIIMIADNYATPRDLSLLSGVNKPIKIIMCGTHGGINTAYLDIARQTKGSLHTIEEDILDLMSLNEGEEIMINNKSYKIVKGKFIQVYRM
jgi:hypothetical protein